ncbi:MAG TPA: DUF2075 domain-containing protein [Candidatus Ozemobacteraceae bacterium]|nr:DUF2075 domain-containing protein [Candidatus Ozemobacteraceae bacterium]
MNRALYSDSIETFCRTSREEILGKIAARYSFSLEQSQRDAWLQEINILQPILQHIPGTIHFEFSIPRLGKYIDVVLVTTSVIFVLEFKIGEKHFQPQAIDQVWDYALDLKNFHETSHEASIAPILIATEANERNTPELTWPENDRILPPVKATPNSLPVIMDKILNSLSHRTIDTHAWENGRYAPTPTIIEAAMALYRGHSVHEISRSDACAINLSRTSQSISDVIQYSKEHSRKSICFVTGVPGAGKTLVGLNVATQHQERSQDVYSVFLSGNGPLVSVLREALSRDKVAKCKADGQRISKKEAASEVQMFIQNVHHFRDECLIDSNSPPIEHVAIFDEAQRAWNLEQTSNFMRQKKKRAGFIQSEPEYLISCLDRHDTWATIICLVGGGQEINTGEAGIREWFESLERSFPTWDIYISPHLTGSEFAVHDLLSRGFTPERVHYRDELHLSVSMRSFRSEHVSKFVGELLDLERDSALETFKQIRTRYPVMLTRDITKAKNWLKSRARGSERYGIMVSSEAQRLKPYAIDVRSKIDPVHWFLDGKDDVRSSYYLEDVGTEFQVQGLELDWACVTWDGDFRYTPLGWEHWSFCGDRWKHIKSASRKIYQKNAYRVLLTRARQGMVIVVPEGDSTDPTRIPSFYNDTYEYLAGLGLKTF